MAIIVGCGFPEGDRYIGKFVTVVRQSAIHADHWRVDPETPHPMDGNPISWFDRHLLPIRPGDLHETEDERKEVTA